MKDEKPNFGDLDNEIEWSDVPRAKLFRGGEL